ncbi:MAG: type II toxin-antitoxin system HicB family antitoxin [Lachnospiraceae bacterium]|nr:type II toxin-antitoxin system HicB family antitoxin [Lachnospiraceae bacterium]
MLYIYTAIFTPIEDGSGYYARVPDLPGCITTGRTLADAIDQITDAMNGWLVVAEDEERSIPNATPQQRLKIPSNATRTLIKADTIAYRAQTDTRSARKNVSLPIWMIKLAEKKNINCSQLLQNALMETLRSR